MGEAGDTFAGVLVGAKCAHEILDSTQILIWQLTISLSRESVSSCVSPLSTKNACLEVLSWERI